MYTPHAEQMERAPVESRRGKSRRKRDVRYDRGERRKETGKPKS